MCEGVGTHLWGQEPPSWPLMWQREPVECGRGNLSHDNMYVKVKVTGQSHLVKVIWSKSPHQSHLVMRNTNTTHKPTNLTFPLYRTETRNNQKVALMKKTPKPQFQSFLLGRNEKQSESGAHTHKKRTRLVGVPELMPTPDQGSGCLLALP